MCEQRQRGEQRQRRPSITAPSRISWAWRHSAHSGDQSLREDLYFLYFGFTFPRFLETPVGSVDAHAGPFSSAIAHLCRRRRCGMTENDRLSLRAHDVTFWLFFCRKSSHRCIFLRGSRMGGWKWRVNNSKMNEHRYKSHRSCCTDAIRTQRGRPWCLWTYRERI